MAEDISLRAPLPEDIAAIKRLRSPRLSPDGGKVLFVVNTPVGETAGTALWTVPIKGGAPVRVLAASNIDSPEWSPDGKWIAYLSNKTSGAHTGTTQVFIATASGQDPRPLTDVTTGVEAFHWSPSGKRIGFLARRESSKSTDPVIVDDVGEPLVFFYGEFNNGAVGDWKTLNIDKDLRDFAWSTQEDEIAAILAPDASPASDFKLSVVVLNLVQNRIARTLSPSAAGVGTIRWSPDGKLVTFFEALPGNIFASWLVVVPAQGGEVKPLLRDEPLTVWDADWDGNSDTLIAEVVRGTGAAILRINTKNGTWRKLFDVMVSQSDFAFSVSSGVIAFTQQASNSPADVWVSDGAKNERRTDLNPDTRNWSLGRVESVSWQNSIDGRQLDGILITPPGYVKGRAVPMVVEAHPGDLPYWQGFHATWWDWGQLLATNGYAVFMPNTRGVTGAGWKAHMTLADWGGLAFQDLEDGVTMLIKQGIADPQRIGIGGWSNGGFMTEYAVTHSSRFRAAVALAGHSDFFSLYGTSRLRYSLDFSFGNPHRDRSKYEERSPIFAAAKCRTPTLIIAGEKDSGVPHSQGLEFHHALKSLGIPTQMVIYPREGHTLQESKHRVDFQRRVLAWFNEHLR